MSRFTVLRVEVDSAVVERLLGVTPGVEVVESFDADEREPPADADEATTPTPPVDDADDEGLIERARPDGELLEEGSPMREYGLLAAGVSFVVLGVATVGIWVYRRRSGGAETAESEFDRGTDTRATEFDADTESDSDAGGESDTEPLSVVRDAADTDEASDEPSATPEADERPGRTDDREDVEWTTKWETRPRPSADESEDDAETDGDEPRASESIDVAPLLGVAFVAVTGVVVRWVRGEA